MKKGNMTNQNEYNQELITVLHFLQEKHKEFKQSTRLKSDHDRRAYAHAIKTVADIAYNCTIQDKKTPLQDKKERVEKNEHTEIFNIATTD